MAVPIFQGIVACFAVTKAESIMGTPSTTANPVALSVQESAEVFKLARADTGHPERKDIESQAWPTPSISIANPDTRPCQVFEHRSGELQSNLSHVKEEMNASTRKDVSFLRTWYCMTALPASFALGATVILCALKSDGVVAMSYSWAALPIGIFVGGICCQSFPWFKSYYLIYSIAALVMLPFAILWLLVACSC